MRLVIALSWRGERDARPFGTVKWKILHDDFVFGPVRKNVHRVNRPMRRKGVMPVRAEEKGCRARRTLAAVEERKV